MSKHNNAQESEQIGESLSALLDNEADDLELRRVLKACEQDSEVGQTWSRFSLVQSLLHDSAVTVSADLRDRVAAAIQADTLSASQSASQSKKDFESPTRSFSGWRQSLSKVAVAASVALVFTVVVQTSLNNTESPSMAGQSNSSESSATASSPLPNAMLAESVTIEVDPAAQRRLREYLSSMAVDEDIPGMLQAPDIMEMNELQDSPLYRLVNELPDKPID